MKKLPTIQRFNEDVEKCSTISKKKNSGKELSLKPKDEIANYPNENTRYSNLLTKTKSTSSLLQKMSAPIRIPIAKTDH